MRQAKHGLWALGSCALSLMAFFVGGAQAELGSAWMVGGKNLIGTQKFEAEAEKDPVLLTEVGKSKVEILCETVTVKEGLLEEGGKGKSTVEFSKGCVTRLNGSISTVCKPTEPIVVRALMLLVTHKLLGGKLDFFVELFPHKNSKGEFEPFTNIKFSELCTLEINEGAGVPITGRIFIKDSQNEASTEKATHLIEEVQTTLGVGLLFGFHPAAADGTTVVFLPGRITVWNGLWPFP